MFVCIPDFLHETKIILLNTLLLYLTCLLSAYRTFQSD